MSFPITHIKGTGLEITDQLKMLVVQKFSALEKFIGDESDVMCNIELEKTVPKQNGDIFRAEANLKFKGKMYRAEATTDQIEKSIDEVRDELQAELRKASDKSKTMLKRGGAMIKNMMRFGR